MAFHLDWMKFYPQETLADGRFQSWTMEERGVWFTLVLQCWTDGSIPAGVTALARFLHMDTGEVTRIWSAIGDRFSPHPTEPGRLVSPRLEEEREKALAIASQRSDAGTKGATSRWNKPKRQHGKRMRPPSQPHNGANAVAIANDAGRGSGSGEQIPPTPQRPDRPARVGVGSPAFLAVQHWREKAWPAMSPAPCPAVTERELPALSRLVADHGTDAVTAAMDRAVADPFWRDKLDLAAFVAKFPRFLARHATGPPKAANGRPDLSQMDYSKIPEF
jgi:hypothetical protein